MGQRYGNNVPTVYSTGGPAIDLIAPGYTTVDAMARYALTDRLRLQVNVYNLGDVNYADALHGFHIVPGAGRSAVFSVAAAF